MSTKYHASLYIYKRLFLSTLLANGTHTYTAIYYTSNYTSHLKYARTKFCIFTI